MMKRTFSLACLLLVAAVGTLAQHWTVDPRAWQYDMTAYAQLKVNGTVAGDYADYEVAAFCGGECRGVAKVLTVEGESPVLYLRIRSNVTDGETITFRVYQASTEEESLLEETIGFESQTMAGTPGEPLVLTLSSVLPGDANGDGVVTIADVTAVINRINNNVSGTFIEEAANVNGDETISIADVTGIINIINK